MGMSIDDVELWAKRNNFTIVADEWWEAAQDIICKYQKIEGIVKSKTTRLSYDVGFEQIREVIEDGNDSTNAENN